jgi:uncharacterized membrane protein YhaH (DUF805 family)
LSNTIIRLLDVRGRIGRARYWRFLIAAIVLFTLLMAAFFVYALSIRGAYENGGPTPFPRDPLGIAGAVLWIALMVAVYAAGITMAIKRLHDRNRAWWWAGVFVIAPNVVYGFGQYFTTTEMAGTASYVVHVFAIALLVWAFVELCCLPGTNGANRFGPDPLA